MPVYNYYSIKPDGSITEDPTLLRLAGPLLNVEISIPTALAQLYNQIKKPIPPPITGWALLDTGAYRTCVDNHTIQSLGVSAVGLEPTLTPAGKKDQNTYPAHFKFPGTNIDLDFGEVIGADLKGQTFNNQPIIALVGRDILSECVFIFNGKAGMYTLAH